jgi:hypothetical protein
VFDISRHCPLLRALYVDDSSVSTTTLCAVVRRCPLLQELGMNYCEGVTDAFLTAVAQHSPQLTVFELCGCRNATDEGVAVVLHCCRSLQDLSIHNCPGISEEARQAVKVRIPRCYL